MRKLRYQQQQMSSRDYLWFSAQKLASAGQARILYHHEKGETVDRCPDFVRIVTATNWNPASVERVLASLPFEGAKNADEAVATILVRPLIVLDLNGILCHRIRRNRPPKGRTRTAHHDDHRKSIATVAGTPVIPRGDLVPFLRMLLQHFCLAIWTSAKAKTAKSLLRSLIPPDLTAQFLFVYSQHHCRAVLPPDDEAEEASTVTADSTVAEAIRTDGYVKPLFVKDLSLVWKEFPLWNANNTLLYDDSPEKCAQWQSNAVHPPSITGTSDDDVSQQQQLEFIRNLVAHWESEPGLNLLDVNADEPTWIRSARQGDWLREQALRLGWDQQAGQ